MRDEPNRNDRSRRVFLEASAVGAIGLSSGLTSTAPTEAATAKESAPAENQVGQLRVASAKSIPKSAVVDLRLQFTPAVDLEPGAKLWLFFDIRQAAGFPQVVKANEPNFLTVEVAGQKQSVQVEVPSHGNWGIRTFDLLPTAPEFLFLVQVTLDKGLSAKQVVDFAIARWSGPQQPIAPYQFWLVVDYRAEWNFVPTGFRSYRNFVARRDKGERVATESLFAQVATASLNVMGE